MKKSEEKILQAGVVLSILIFCFACGRFTTPDRIKAEDVKALKFFYLPLDIDIQVANRTIDNMFGHDDVLMDTIISDRGVIEDYISLVNRLEPSDEEVNHNYWIYSIIYLNNDRTVEMGYGSLHWRTVFEGQLMRDDPELFKFLDDLLYDGEQGRMFEKYGIN